jgi:ketosteroid isomerase-like protein
MSSQNIQFARNLYAAFAGGDIPAVLAMFDPQIQWREAEGNPYQLDGAAWIGPQAVLEKLFQRIGAEWNGFALTVRTLHDAGDHVVMEGRYTGTYKSTGKSIDAQACHVLRFKDGKLVSFQQYVDTAQLQAALGAV